MNIQAPQLVYLGIVLLGLGVSLAKNGEPKKDNHSFGWSLFANAITITILSWGGFFG